MKKIIIDHDNEKINLDIIPSYHPIFAKENSKLSGMIVNEDKGWILRIGGSRGACGFFKTRKECIEKAVEHGYEFFCEDF